MTVTNEELTAFAHDELPTDWDDDDVKALAEILARCDLELVTFVDNEQYDYAIQRSLE